MAIHKEIQVSKPAEEIYRQLKQLFHSEVPADLHNAAVWDDQRRTASLSAWGAKGEFRVAGENPCTLTMDASIGFPASLKISEKEFGEQIDGLLDKLTGRIK